MSAGNEQDAREKNLSETVDPSHCYRIVTVKERLFAISFPHHSSGGSIVRAPKSRILAIQKPKPICRRHSLSDISADHDFDSKILFHVIHVVELHAPTWHLGCRIGVRRI